MIRALFAAPPAVRAAYDAPLTAAFSEAGLAVDLAPDHDPGEVDYIVYAPDGGPIRDFRRYTRLKAVLCLWAGVETVVGNPTLTVPLCRMVEPGLREGMVEWVAGQVLRHHLGLDRYLGARRWEPVYPPLARDRRVAVLGLGELGAAVAQALAALNFDVAGWSRRPKALAGVETFSGAAGLQTVLARAEILVLLLPHTPETEGLIGADALGRLPRGAVLINPGRGALIEDAALIAALDEGRLSHATLDVFRTEPLPPDHPFWAHPGITVTPHVASATRAPTAARVVAENIRRGAAGAPFLHVVDRSARY